MKFKRIASLLLASTLVTLSSCPTSAFAASQVSPDPYESNDSIDTAFPYSKMEVLKGNSFINGYHNSNHHTDTDEDFFSIRLYAGNNNVKKTLTIFHFIGFT